MSVVLCGAFENGCGRAHNPMDASDRYSAARLGCSCCFMAGPINTSVDDCVSDQIIAARCSQASNEVCTQLLEMRAYAMAARPLHA